MEEMNVRSYPAPYWNMYNPVAEASAMIMTV